MPWTSRVVTGAVPMPNLVLVVSIVKTFVVPAAFWKRKAVVALTPGLTWPPVEPEPPRVMMPEIEAVPPTSKLVSVKFPELIPNLLSPVISKLVEIEAPEPNRTKPSKAAEPFTSRPPEMIRSSAVEMVPVWVVAVPPNLE